MIQRGALMLGMLAVAAAVGCGHGTSVQGGAHAFAGVPGGKAVSSTSSTESLIGDLDTKDGELRAAATKELFRRGPAVLPALKQQGAKLMETIEPPRRDVVMTLIAGLDKSVQAKFKPRSFGLHLTADVTRDQLVEMGRRHHFRVRDGAVLRADAAPTVYVDLADDARLEDVLQSVLCSEPGVRTVNLNYIDRG